MATDSREPPRPADMQGFMQDIDQSKATTDKTRYIKVAKVEAWVQEKQGNRPCIRLRITYKDNRIQYASLWDTPYPATQAPAKDGEEQ